MSATQPTAQPRPLPLEGVTVIDLSQIYTGPYATFLLATAGATVIKIEPSVGLSPLMVERVFEIVETLGL